MPQVLEAARALSPEIAERATESEAARTLPRDLVDKMAAARIFLLGVPKALDGLECEPTEIIEVVEAVSHADGSAGWCAFIGNTTCFTAWLDPEVARPMLATTPNGAMAGTFSPTGQAVPGGDPKTFTVSGRWAFNSGCPHSSWLLGGVLVMNGDRPRMLGEGQPDWRWAWFPAADAEILDTWHVSGLKGTGSHDVTVSGVTVPEDRMCMPFFHPARHDGPLYRLSFFNLLYTMFSGFPLGVARRALDEFVVLAERKSRSASGLSMADDPIVQVEVGRADAALRAARSHIFEAVGDAWDAVRTHGESTFEQRVRLGLAAHHVMRTAVATVDAVFALAGGGALYDSSPLQRCWRDIHAGSHHIAFSSEMLKRHGAGLLGREVETHLI